jgi:tetratricopeptide (TPR) repeat protein
MAGYFKPDLVHELRRKTYLRNSGLAVEVYLGLLRERASVILAQGKSVGYPASLAASLHLALEQVSAEDPAALVLLRLASQCATEPIPLTLFTTHPDQLPAPLKDAAADPVAFVRVTGLVRRRALARVGPDSLQLHRLVQAILRSNSVRSTPTSGEMTTLARRLLRKVMPADPWDNPASWPVWRQLLPHVLAVTDPTQDARGAHSDTVQVAWLLDHAATYLHARGEPQPAHALFHRAHQLRRDSLGEDHPDTLASANNLAAVLRALGEYRQTHTLDEDALTHRRQILGEDHPSTLTSASNLARDLYALGEYRQARTLDEDILTRCRRILGEDHPDTLASANNLAAVLRELGEYRQAHTLDEDTLTRCRRVLGEDHPHTLASASNLARDLYALGEDQQARELEAWIARQRGA